MDRNRSRLAVLERRVERLTSVLIIQSVLLGLVILMAAVRTAPFLALGAIIALPILVFYRNSLPQWARSLGRLAGQFRNTEPASRRAKKSAPSKRTSDAA